MKNKEKKRRLGFREICLTTFSQDNVMQVIAYLYFSSENECVKNNEIISKVT